MPIFEGSRYEDAALLRVRAADGAVRPTTYLMVMPNAAVGRFHYHALQAGERMDQLAAHYYGDPELWWRIASMNPEYLYPDDLPPGAVIRIPA